MSPATSTPRSYPFAIANAFTQDAFGGNPAAIVFLDPSNTLTQEERLKFAKGFNQPVVVFLTPTSTSTEDLGAVVSFDVQYFAPACEIELCGHGTVAAIKVILDSATDSPGFGRGTPFPAFSSPGTHTVEFITANKTVVSARKVGMTNEVSGKEEDWFEIVLPAGKLRNLPTEEEEKILGIFNRAVGRESKVKYIGIGEPPFQHDLLIVLDEDEEIEKLKLNAEVLKATGFDRHIVTTDSTSGKFTEDYITRMFAPIPGIDEDHVCGSANCTMGPYWATQKGITELKVRQVSERGGKLKVGIDEDNIKLCGQVYVTSVGQLFL